MGQAVGLHLGQQELPGGNGLQPSPRPTPPQGGQLFLDNTQTFSHAVVSIRFPATTVTFSTTEAPRVPLSPILLHWQAL